MSLRRVLFVTTSFELDRVTNGPGVYAQNLWRMFSDDPEIELHVVAATSDIQHPHVHVLPELPKGFGSAVYKAVDSLAKSVISSFSSDTILHVNSAHIVSPARVRSSPSIVQVNDTEVCQWRPTISNFKRYGFRRNLALAWRRRREKSVVLNSCMTVCNSNHTKSAVRQEYRISAERVTTIYKAIDLAPFHEASLRHAPDESTLPTLVFVGSNWRRKGLDTLCHTIAQLKQSRCQIRLLIFGVPDDAMKSEIETLVEVLNISEYVSFRGRIDRKQLPLELAKARALILPSREEALGLAAIEALATGIPVVASNVGGLPEIVTNETCGKLVVPGDAPGLAEAIRSVLELPIDSRSKKFRQDSVTKFGATRLESELRQLYKDIGRMQSKVS